MAIGIPKKQFEVWLRKQLYILTDRGLCTKVVLRRSTASSRMGQEVLATDVPEGADVDDNWIDETVKDIEETAQADANGCGSGIQKYMIQVYHDSPKPTANFAIRITGDIDEDEEMFSEPASKHGVLAQLMRHNEATMRTATIGQATVLGTMQKTVARQETMIERMIEDRFNSLAIMETLMSQQNERDIETAKATQKMDNTERLVDKAMLLLPTIINKFGSKSNNGQKLLSEPMNPLEHQMASLVDTITPEQLEDMPKVFTSDQMMVLISMLTQVKQKHDNILEKEHNPESKG